MGSTGCRRPTTRAIPICWNTFRQQDKKQDQPQDQKQDQQQDQKQDQQQGQQKPQDQQGKDQQKKDSDNSRQPGGQESPQQQKGQQQRPEDSASPKGQSAFGDMKKPEPSPSGERPTPGDMQKVGGVAKEQQNDPAFKDPALAASLEKLEQVKSQDSPAELFNLLRKDDPMPPSDPNGKNW